jgi:HK97 family phage major capsid protein
VDYEIERKLNELADSNREKLDKSSKQIDEIITELARMKCPDLRDWSQLGNKSAMRTPEQKAFDGWYRTGTLTPDEKKTLTIGSDPSFGFACPPQLETSILHALTEGNPLRGISRVYQTSNTSLEILKKSASGAVVLQSSEVGEIIETTGLAYAKITATPATEVYLLKAGLSFLEDSKIDMDAEIALELGEAFSSYEAAAQIAVLVGNGGDGTLNTYKELHAGSTSVITADIIMSLIYTLPTRFLSNAKFLVNRSTLAYIRTIKSVADGRYMFIDSRTSGVPSTLAGFPVIVHDSMPSISSANYVLAFGDFSKGFGIVDRTPGFTVQRMAERYAEFGIVGFLARFRTISTPLVGEAIVLLQMSA